VASALILIDIQTGFDAPFWGARNNPMAEENAARLLRHWRNARHPICHIRHISTTPGSPLSRKAGGTEFKLEVTPGPDEPIFEKSVNSAFIGTTLQSHLDGLGLRYLTLCGLTTPHCVSTTARMAANLGFGVTIAHDACAAFARNDDTSWHPALTPMAPEAIHIAAISELHDEFALARSTDDILSGQA
jgi:nicotinamidase-related amidase